MIARANCDPQISCPIVCGEYFRATGFFYAPQSATTPYLVTARHNLRPTHSHIPHPRTDDTLWSVEANHDYSLIDLYLRPTNDVTRTWAHKRIDLRMLAPDQIVSVPTADIFAVQLPFDPQQYGYRVFYPDDITTADDEAATFIEYGFATDAFSQAGDEYTIQRYTEEIGLPNEVELENWVAEEYPLPDKYKTIYGRAADTTPTKDAAYNGLSGTPILGDGLVGIHSGTNRPSEKACEVISGVDEVLFINFYSAVWLAELISEG